MRIAKRLLFIPLLALLLPSCSTDFKVAAPYKSITLVYGLLNVADTAHYIRIQKAFLDDSKSSLTLAKLSDSNYFQSLDVHLKEFSNGMMLGDEILPRVNLKSEHLPKDTGIFFSDSSYAYKSTRVLTPGNIYRLVIRNPATGETDSAQTPVLSNSPFGFNIDLIFSQSYTLAFPAQFVGQNLDFTFQAPDSSGIFDGTLRFHYVNVNTSTNVRTNDSVDLYFNTLSQVGSLYDLSVDQKTVQRFLLTSIGPASQGTSRLMGKVDISIWAGANAFAQYLLINGVKGGLTADEIKPIYTNLSGANVLGLFSSRTVRTRYGVKIDDLTMDSLMSGSITSPLNITGRAN